MTKDEIIAATDKAEAEYFLRLMKALLKSQVIAKSPLKNAPDIRGLYNAKLSSRRRGILRGGCLVCSSPRIGSGNMIAWRCSFRTSPPVPTAPPLSRSLLS